MTTNLHTSPTRGVDRGYDLFELLSESMLWWDATMFSDIFWDALIFDWTDMLRLKVSRVFNFAKVWSVTKTRKLASRKIFPLYSILLWRRWQFCNQKLQSLSVYIAVAVVIVMVLCYSNYSVYRYVELWCHQLYKKWSFIRN